MALHRAITVFGAYGHTGRFVVSELRRRGWVPVLAGRDAAKLSAASETQPGMETRVALIDDPATLDRALSGAAAVINCAGPFIDTAAPLVEAALRAGIPYLDIAAEQSSVLALFDRAGDRLPRASETRFLHAIWRSPGGVGVRRRLRGRRKPD